MKTSLLQYVVLFVAVSLGLSLNNVYAQKVEPNRWFVKADGGFSVFFGDIKRYDIIPDFESPSEIQPMFGLSVGKELSKIFSVHGQFIYGQLSGHKKKSHMNFKSTVMGGHALVDINLMYLFQRARFGDLKVNAYASVGAGYLTWDSELFSDTPAADGTDLLASNKDGAFSIPLSLNLEYMFTKSLSMNLEGALYVVTSDFVDAKEGGFSLDMVNYNSLGITYRFGSKKKKTKHTKVKYTLDPDLYEAEVDTPEEVTKEEVLSEEAATETQEVEIVEAEPIQEKDDNVVQDGEIDHAMEAKMIEKEKWNNNQPWGEILFSVQIYANKVPMDKDKISRDLKLSETVYEHYDGDWYRYSVGQYDKMWKAKELRNKMRSVVGVKDAFVVVYKGDNRITLEEALNYAFKVQKSNIAVSNDEQSKVEKVYESVALKTTIPQSGLFYGVQILSIEHDHFPLGIFDDLYGIEKPIVIKQKSTWYMIIASGFDSYQDAVDYQPIARNKGFIDAFVVAYKDGKKISLEHLKEELNK